MALQIAVLVSRLNKEVCDARFARRVAGVSDDLEIGLGPRLVEVPRAHHRADKVITLRESVNKTGKVEKKREKTDDSDIKMTQNDT